MLDIEKFITEVEKYPPIYDHRANNYKNKHVKIKCWHEVGRAMFENWHNLPHEVQDQRSKLLIRKWKGIRDNFVREYKILRRCEREGGPPLKKSKYLHFDRLLFLAPFVYGKFSHNTEMLDEMPSDDVKPFQLLEMIYGDGDDGGNRRTSERIEASLSETTKSTKVRRTVKSVTSGNPQDENATKSGASRIPEEWALEANALKSMTTKIPEPWTTTDKVDMKSMTIKIPDQWAMDKNAMKSMTFRIPDELSTDRNGAKSVSSRIMDGKETITSGNPEITVSSSSPVMSNITSISASTVPNPTHDFTHDNVPFHYDERNQDKSGNKAFLLSFVPIIDSLPLHLSLQARMRITEVFNDLVSSIPSEGGACTEH